MQQQLAFRSPAGLGEVQNLTLEVSMLHEIIMHRKKTGPSPDTHVLIRPKEAHAELKSSGTHKPINLTLYLVPVLQ